MRSYLYILLLSLGVLSNGLAQELPFQSAFLVKYDVNIPLANRNFLDNTSFVGFEIEGKWKVASNITCGIGVNWSTYYQYQPRATYPVRDGLDITTDLYKYIYTLPITFNTQYHFTPGEQVIPYVGMGIGTCYANHKVLFNGYETSDHNWGIALRPEIGAAIFLGRESTTALHAAIRYSYLSNGNEELNYNNFQSLGFQLGLNFTMYE
ncbi:MAG: outer membrane beta-barrel protein [Cytophagaceae bacterium]|jgi:outer membrane protein|nr:outer membrane beta-barrel protein [Cytophagaceae bacterium]